MTSAPLRWRKAASLPRKNEKKKIESNVFSARVPTALSTPTTAPRALEAPPIKDFWVASSSWARAKIRSRRAANSSGSFKVACSFLASSPTNGNEPALPATAAICVRALSVSIFLGFTLNVNNTTPTKINTRAPDTVSTAALHDRLIACCTTASPLTGTSGSAGVFLKRPLTLPIIHTKGCTNTSLAKSMSRAIKPLSRKLL